MDADEKPRPAYPNRFVSARNMLGMAAESVSMTSSNPAAIGGPPVLIVKADPSGGYQGSAYNNFRTYGQDYTYGHYRYDGTGQINSFNATIRSGNIQGDQRSFSSSVNGDSYQSGDNLFTTIAREPTQQE